MIDNIIILGGGTAGLVAASMLKTSFPKLDVTLIESSKYGIVGVGEGSTEHWKTFMEHCNIDPLRLFSETGATYKTGIKFENWHGDDTSYWHSLPEFASYPDTKTSIFPTMVKIIADNSPPDFSVYPMTLLSRHAEPFHDIMSQYHFDTFKLNKFLHDVCFEKGVSIVDDIIEDVIVDEHGFVTSLKGVKGLYTSEFFIDASGFRRIISMKLGVKWKDQSDYLPMNSAIAAPSRYEDELPSHTVAKALSAGWSWRIPTQDRFGNGYVYCDKFITDNDAEKEFKGQFNYNIEIGKKFKFSAGYLDELWTKNCVSIGLSALFVEPLEASSIGSTIQQMFGFISSIIYWDKDNLHPAKRFNTDFLKVASNIVDFIQLHYITQRRDTEFWRWINTEVKLTDFNAEHLERFKNYLPGINDFNYHYLMFKEINYMQVMHGLRLFNNNKIKEMYQKHFMHFDQYIEDGIKNTRETCYNTIEQFRPHRECLNTLKQRYKEQSQ